MHRNHPPVVEQSVSRFLLPKEARIRALSRGGPPPTRSDSKMAEEGATRMYADRTLYLSLPPFDSFSFFFFFYDYQRTRASGKIFHVVSRNSLQEFLLGR